jgi:hypothetical protein
MTDSKQKFRKVRMVAAMLCLACGAAGVHAGSDHHHGYAAKRKGAATQSIGAQDLPTLRILSPKDGARVGRTISIEFETPADLSKMTMSAKEIGAHLHIDMDVISLMPAQADFKPLGGNRYRYTFDLPAEPGQRVLKVYWSDAAHKTIEETVQQVTVTVGDDAPGKKK